MRCFEGFGNLTTDLEYGFGGKWACDQELGYRFALDEFEHEEAGAAVLFQTVDRCDIRMVQRRQQLRLTFKPGQAFFVLCELFGQRLDGDFPPEFGVPRTPYLSHAAFSEGRNDLVVRELGTGLNHTYMKLHKVVNSNQTVTRV